jgi:hypothetical protein
MNLFRTKYLAHKTKYFASTQYSYIFVKLEYVETILTMPQAQNSKAQILTGARQKSPLQNFQTGSATSPASCSLGPQTLFLGHKVGYSPTIQCSPNKPSDTDRCNPFFVQRTYIFFQGW